MAKGIKVRKRPGKCSDKGVVTQSTRRLEWSKGGCAMAIALAGALAGCSMSSLTSGIGGGWFGGGEKAKTEVGTVSEDQLLAAAKTDGGTTGSLASMWRTAVRASKCGRARAT